MAYQTGSATSQNDLLQQLVTWLQGQGWTIEASQADGSGWRAHLSKSSHHLHLKTKTTGTPFTGYVNNDISIPSLFCYLSTAFAGLSYDWNQSLTGAPLGTDNQVVGVGLYAPTSAIYGYYFFHDGSDHYTIVVERSAGLFQAFGFGLNIAKHGGNWTGGSYLHGHMQGGNTSSTPSGQNAYCPFYYGTFEYGTCNSAFLRADIGTFTGKWIGIGPFASAARLGGTGRQGFSTVAGYYEVPNTIPHTSDLVGVSVSIVNSQAVLLPIRLYALDDDSGSVLLATVPAVFQCNAVGNGYLALDEIALGGDTYKLFPNFAVRKVV